MQTEIFQRTANAIIIYFFVSTISSIHNWLAKYSNLSPSQVPVDLSWKCLEKNKKKNSSIMSLLRIVTKSRLLDDVNVSMQMLIEFLCNSEFKKCLYRPIIGWYRYKSNMDNVMNVINMNIFLSLFFFL